MAARVHLVQARGCVHDRGISALWFLKLGEFKL